MKYFFIILIFVFNTVGRGQDFLAIDKSKGLPSNYTYQVIQSLDKFIWVLTDQGIVRYDGSVFTNFNVSEGLRSNENYEAFNTGQSELIFLGANGKVSKMLGNAAINLENTDEYPEFDHFISHYASRNGLSVFSSFGGGLAIKNNGWTQITTEHGLLDNYVSFCWIWGDKVFAISKNGIVSIDRRANVNQVLKFENSIHFARALEMDNGILFTGNEKLLLFNKKAELKEIYGGEEVTRYDITRLQRFGDKIAATSYNGLHLIDIENNELKAVEHFLTGIVTTSVIIDHESNVWVSTFNDGVLRIEDLKTKPITEDFPVFTLAKDSLGNVYFGTLDNTYGIIRDGEVQLNQLADKKQYANQKIRNIQVVQGVLYMDTDGGLAILQNEKLSKYRTGVGTIEFYGDTCFIANKIGCFMIPSRDQLKLLSKGNNELLISDIATCITAKPTFSLYEFNDTLYIGTSQGTAIYAIESGDFSSWMPDSNFKVQDIYVDQNNKVITYEEDGVLVITNNDTVRVTSNSGLSTDFCYRSEIISNVLYVATSKGLNILDLTNLRSRKFDFAYRLKSKTIYDFLILDSAKMLLATDNGAYLAPVYTSKSSFKIAIQPVKIAVNNNDRALQKIYHLDYDQNDISITFNTIAFSEKVQNWYQLNNEPWKPFEEKLLFKELNPGIYKLKLKATSSEGYSDVQEYEFVVHKPWWSTWWFRLLVLGIIIAVIYWFFKVRILTYNRDIVRELLQVLLNRLKREKYIIVKDIKDGSKTKIVINQLLYAESSRNYVTLFCLNNRIVVRSSLKEILKKLNDVEQQFLRCHRSYIVNTKKISAVHNDFLKVNDQKIPIGSNYLESTKSKMALLNADRKRP